MYRPPTATPAALVLCTTAPAASKRKLGVLLVLVRLELVRSAEPPIISGRAAVNASSASCDAVREATVSILIWAGIAVFAASWLQFFGCSPLVLCSSSLARSG